MPEPTYKCLKLSANSHLEIYVINFNIKREITSSIAVDYCYQLRHRPICIFISSKVGLKRKVTVFFTKFRSQIS